MSSNASAFPAPVAPTASVAPPRPAASLVVVRDGDGGIEVLLSRRAERGDHNSNAWVFPGGLVDPGDASLHDCCAGLDDAEASRRLGLASGGLDYVIAAVRECFEESGLLFASGSDGAPVEPDARLSAELRPWRARIHQGQTSLGELCKAHGWRLAAGELVYLSHWLTPLGRPKRFDTRFFVAALPRGQQPLHDGIEIVEQAWLDPAEALARSASMKLLTPTQKTLETLARFASVAELLSWAAAPRLVPLVTPRVASGSAGHRPVLPDEPAWAEIGRIDPAGHGHASYDIVAGRAVRLSSRVLRVTAGNPSAMTGPGTNSYLVGEDGADWAVIDPGPALAAHIDALLAAAPGPITRIFVTHTHTDHSPATQALQQRTGARVFGLPPLHREWQDETFRADEVVQGGERFSLAPGTHLTALHTPGHAANHLCYLLEEEKTLFTGDHVMQASTVVINPPDGDMAAYLSSLAALRELDLDWLAPGHGFLMAEPRAAFDAIVAHRLRREGKVAAALQKRGRATSAQLLPDAYDDVAPRLLPMALRSLEAHLLKLYAEARIGREGEVWVGSPSRER